MNHFKEVCQYGYIHSQCRCPGPKKTLREINCNVSFHATKAVKETEIWKTKSAPTFSPTVKRGPYVVLQRHRDSWENPNTDVRQPFSFVSKAANHKILSRSSERYSTRKDALRAIEIVHPGLPVIEREVETVEV